jgi:hypothetical protein
VVNNSSYSRAVYVHGHAALHDASVYEGDCLNSAQHPRSDIKEIKNRFTDRHVWSRSRSGHNEPPGVVCPVDLKVDGAAS